MHTEGTTRYIIIPAEPAESWSATFYTSRLQHTYSTCTYIHVVLSHIIQLTDLTQYWNAKH